LAAIPFKEIIAAVITREYLHWMYKCREHPFTGKPKKVFAQGKEFLSQMVF